MGGGAISRGSGSGVVAAGIDFGRRVTRACTPVTRSCYRCAGLLEVADVFGNREVGGESPA